MGSLHARLWSGVRRWVSSRTRTFWKDLM